MAKSKSPESQPISKKSLLSAREIQGIGKLRALITQVEELTKDGIPYQEARRVKAEFQVRGTIREIFGEQSPEYQSYQQHQINADSETELAKTVSMLHDLIAGLEGKKPTGGGNRPSTHSSEGRTAKHEKAPAPAKPVEPAAPPEGMAKALELVLAGVAPKQTQPSDSGKGHAVASAEPRVIPSPRPPEARSPLDALGFIRMLCTRFHAVARELRQRSENRLPFDVEDEHDVRDMVRALVCVMFEDFRTEEWTPPYAGGASRADLVLKGERIVIVVKKTRQGLGAKEIADQMAIDLQRFSTHSDCQTLFCFIYDPEGRLVNPRRLEAELTQVSDGRTVEVLIAPK
jgi:REase_DpnII-MboI